jgi:cytochrome c
MYELRAIAVCAVLAAGSTRAWAAGKPGDAAKGKAVFEQCSGCHAADTKDKKVGPGLKGLFKAAKLTDGKKPTEANVRGKIDQGGGGMPAYKELLSDPEKNDLIAYLKTL